MQKGYMQGLHVGDVIRKVDGKNKENINDITYSIALSGKDTFDFTVERQGAEVIVENVTLPTREQEGMKSAYLDCVFVGKPRSFSDGISYAFSYMGSMVRMIWETIKGLVTGVVPLSSASSLVGVAAAVEQNISQNFTFLFAVLALVSVNLAVVNLLPLPALDGGLILIEIIEGVTKKKLNEKVIRTLNRVFLTLLMGLSLLLIVLDIVKLL